MNDSDQRTNEWFLARKGMITASEFFYLMKGKERKEEVPMTDAELSAFQTEHPRSKVTTKKITVTEPFTDATYTYLNRKIAERYMTDESYLEYVQDSQINSRAMQWGTLMEDAARDAYCNKTGIKVGDSGFVTLEGCNIAGGSPDGICFDEDGRGIGGIEIKNPYNPQVHLDHLLLKTSDDLKNEFDGQNQGQYYWQCKFCMLCTGLKWWDFVSYDCRISKSKQLKILRLFPDSDETALMTDRLEMATDYMTDRMTELDEACK